MIVLLAFVINAVVFIFLVHRRSTGLVSRNYLTLLREATNFEIGLDSVGL